RGIGDKICAGLLNPNTPKGEISTMTFRALGSGFCLLLSFATIALASAPIPVANLSFETLPPGGLPNSCNGTGCVYSVGPIPGWTNSGICGQWQPGNNTLFFNYIPDGSTVAYSSDPGGTITQTVGTVAPNTTYTLRVDLGLRSDGYDSLGTVALLI